ncbi:DUF6596 domain-containing protein [Pedobacter sp. Hv1]|uniref:DUF6596 domain-containing protein n=1 Tax=Pedobacter sp. Hv1 TaxID=1740090 RepID=UPI0006D89C10|nr:DUF6596 domain-containing protein [Pedobacter sp. Hv1]KQC02195.1 hypothetical protein AQF98_01065 [Pedobacter sp. Hv1]
MTDEPTLILAKLYRSYFGKMLSALIYHTGIKDIAVCEDIVQEAFVIAAEKWSQNLPDQPEAWLYKTIRNIAYNTLKKANKKQLFEEDYQIPIQCADNELQLLKVLYVCAQSAFSPKIQLIVALRYINGLQVKRIAALLGTDEDSISKVLYRWRAESKNHQWDFEQEVDFNREPQLKRVLKIVYVMFTEGFKLSVKGTLTDQVLCEDALSILQTLIKMGVSAAREVKALYALLLYHLARSCSRLNAIDELVELAEQDRSCWNKEMIAVANGYLLESKRESKKNSSYQLEAAIAYLHTSALTFNAINWPQIAHLYTKLQQLNPSPFITLNHAVALYLGGAYEAAVQLLNGLSTNNFFKNHHLLHCFWAKIYQDQQQLIKALSHYQEALLCPINALEEQFIKKKMAAIQLLN